MPTLHESVYQTLTGFYTEKKNEKKEGWEKNGSFLHTDVFIKHYVPDSLVFLLFNKKVSLLLLKQIWAKLKFLNEKNGRGKKETV